MIVGLDPRLDEVAEKGIENLIIGRGSASRVESSAGMKRVGSRV